MKKLSIIVPVYHPTINQLTVALSSISNSIGVDFSQIDVHLVNDAGQDIELEKYAIFRNLELNLHHLSENRGIGCARQYGIDHSEGDYVMFMNQDDQLYSVTALRDFFEAINTTGEHEILIGQFVKQEPHSEGKLEMKAPEVHNTLLTHAKFFKRSFLDGLGLRFHPQLRYFEDYYFVQLACVFAKDVYNLNTVVYARLYNVDSASRSEGGRQEMTLSIPDETRFYLGFLRDRGVDIANSFDAGLANCYTYYMDAMPWTLERRTIFAKKVQRLTAESPVEFSGFAWRVATGEGRLYDLLRSDIFNDFLKEMQKLS